MQQHRGRGDGAAAGQRPSGLPDIDRKLEGERGQKGFRDLERALEEVDRDWDKRAAKFCSRRAAAQPPAIRRHSDVAVSAMTRPARKLSLETEVMSSAAYRIQAMVDGLDQVAVAMERKWGVGRLRLLVSDFLRAKFDEQKDRLDAAIQSGEERYIASQVDGKHVRPVRRKALSKVAYPNALASGRSSPVIQPRVAKSLRITSPSTPSSQPSSCLRRWRSHPQPRAISTVPWRERCSPNLVPAAIDRLESRSA